MAFDKKDPLDVALEIKRHFARVAASRDKHQPGQVGYLVGVMLWWLVVFAALLIATVDWKIAAIVASAACWFWPLLMPSRLKR